jgi:hypothetical protein
MHARGRCQSVARAVVLALISPICGVLYKARQQFIVEAAHSLSHRMFQHALMHVLVLFTAASGFGELECSDVPCQPGVCWGTLGRLCLAPHLFSLLVVTQCKQ